MYESLTKYYYKNPQKHEQEYLERFQNQTSVKIPLYIKAWRGNNYQLFYMSTPEILNIIIEIYENIQKNTNIINTISDSNNSAFLKYYRKEMLVDEVLSTNEIEGIRSTKKELEEACQLVEASKKKPRFYHVVRKYANLMDDEINVLKNAEDLRTVYDEFISDEINIDNKLDGKLFRKESVDVIDSKGNGLVVHQGIYGEDQIIHNLEMLISYMNDDHQSPLLIKVAVFQYYFGYIHPFYDGNGRVSRYLMSSFLKNVDDLLPFKISKIILNNVHNFYKLFDEANQEINKGDLTPFITNMLLFFLAGVEELNEELNKYSRLFSQFYKFVDLNTLSNLFDVESIQMLYIVYQSTIYNVDLSIKDIEAHIQLSYRPVKKRLDDLVNHNYIYRKEHSNYKLTEEMMTQIFEV